MEKMIILILVLNVLLLGCIQQQDKFDFCMVGCAAGVYYNNGSFQEIPQIDKSNVNIFLDCENLCKVAIQNNNLVERTKKYNPLMN